MKKLKITLALFLISLFFIPNVFARTTGTYTKIENTQAVKDLKEQYSEEIQLITNYINSHGFGERYLSSGQYVLRFDTQTFSNNTFIVTLFSYVSGNNNFYNTYLNGSGSVRLYASQNHRSYSVNNGVVSDNGPTGNISGFMSWVYQSESGCDPITQNCIIQNNRYIYDASYLNSNINIQLYEITYNNPYNIGLNIKEHLYGMGESFPLKDFIESFDYVPYDNPFTCSFDSDDDIPPFRDSNLSNISEFSIHITGVIPPNSDSYDGSFALVKSGSPYINDDTTTFDITAKDLSSEPNLYPVAVTSHWYNDTNTLIVTYSIGEPLHNVEQNIDLVITVSPNNNSTSSITFFDSSLNLFYCTPGNITNDITYGYIDNDTGTSVSRDTSLLNFLNNTNNPNLSFFTRLNTLLPPGPLDSILTLPLKVLNSINNVLTMQCVPLTVNLPFVNKNITLNCISSFYQTIGLSTFLNWVGIIASTLMLLKYFIFLYNYFDGMLMLEHYNVNAWGATDGGGPYYDDEKM